ncbi:MAG: VapE domain-containing protein [Phycisphaerales bacterium]
MPDAPATQLDVPTGADILRECRDYADGLKAAGASRDDRFTGLASVVRVAVKRVTDGEMSQAAADEFVKDIVHRLGFESDELHVKQVIQVASGDFIRSKGVVLPVPHNARLAISKLGVRFQYDEFAERVRMSGLDGFGPDLSDNALIRLRFRIDKRFRVLFTTEMLHQVVVDVALEEKFHPVRRYLDSLVWDRRPRLASWLMVYAGAEDSMLNRAIGSITLMAAVRRVRKPGVKFDPMPILQGPQGTGKSTCWQTLAGDEWFTDNLSLTGRSKEALEITLGRWIVEIPELAGLRRSESETVKAFQSRTEDSARPAYGRVTVTRPRQFILVGTANPKKYLQDRTGNRRFLPVTVGTIDLAGLRRDRDQLWAEAAYREAEGESITLPKSLWLAAEAAQDERLETHPFEECLAPVLDGVSGAVRSDDLWACLGLGTPGDRRQADNSALGQIMARLGWNPARLRWDDGRRFYGYVKGDAAKRLRLKLRDTGGGWEAVQYASGDEGGLGV